MALDRRLAARYSNLQITEALTYVNVETGRHKGILGIFCTKLTPRSFLNFLPFLALAELPQKGHEVEFLSVMTTNAVGKFPSVFSGF